MRLDRFRASLAESPVIRMGDYDYFVHPVTDGVPSMDPRILNEIVDSFIEMGDFRCDLILAPEAMGIPLAVTLAMRLGIPYSIVRKKRYSLEGETQITQVTGYSRTDIFINGVKRGDRVVIVDDVISTGGTLAALVDGLERIGADIVDILVAVEKGPGRENLEKKIGRRIKTLVRLDIVDGRLELRQ